MLSLNPHLSAVETKQCKFIHGTHISGSKMHIINGDLGTSFLDFLVEPSKVAKGMIVR